MANNITEMMKTLNKPEDSELDEKELESVTGGVDYDSDSVVIDWDNMGSLIDWDEPLIKIDKELPNSKPYKGGFSRTN